VKGTDESTGLLLDEKVCFALYAASRAVTDVYRPILARLGLTYPQYLVMLVLWERGEATVREIGEALDLDYGTVSPLLKRLEKRGTLLRRRSEADERTVTVELSPYGRELRTRAEPVPAQIGCALQMDAPQRRELITTLRAITASAQRYGEASDSAGT
jgi:DNA-binding MarR family transcriptional regulator